MIPTGCTALFIANKVKFINKVSVMLQEKAWEGGKIRERLVGERG